MNTTPQQTNLARVTAATSGALAVTENPANTAALVASLVLNGDISGLDPSQKAVYYVQRCRQLGLDPASKPFQVLKLNGKEILYTDKGAADQLAKLHHVTRRITDGPRVHKIGSREMLYCVCEASTPDGRSEMDVATLPIGDLDNALMKLVTKAKRRATLAILGLGCLDESELSTIPDRVIGERVDVDLALAGIEEPKRLSAGVTRRVNVHHDAGGESLGEHNQRIADAERAIANGEASDDVDDEFPAIDATSLDGLAAWYAGLGLRAEDTERADAAVGLACDYAIERGYRLASPELHSVLAGRLHPTLRAIHDALAKQHTPAAVVAAYQEHAGAVDQIEREDGRKACVTVGARYFGERHSPALSAQARGPAFRAALSPQPPTPTGTDAPTASAPASADGGSVAPSQSAGAQASASPRLVLDPEETEARYLRDDAIGAEAWASHLAACVGVFAMAGAHTKRVEAFRAAGVLAARRGATLDAIEAREGAGADRARECLDGYRTRQVVPIGTSVRARSHREQVAANASLKTAVGQ